MPFKDYLFVFAQAHDGFRIPELQSISELHGFTIGFSRYNDLQRMEAAVKRPFMILELEKEVHARLLAERCILIKAIYEFYSQGSSYNELHQANREVRSRWERYIPNTSFRFTVVGYNHGLSQRWQRDVIESFSYMDFLGKIDLRKPEIVLGCFEECATKMTSALTERITSMTYVQVRTDALKVAEGAARTLIKTFDVKARNYFGNTSMEAEISLLMANQTQAAPGKLIYDPFIGTGSMAYTTAHFGALIYGSDIDGRQMRGKGKTPGIIRAASQYGVVSRIMDLCTFDVTNNPWRIGGLFDAIVTDPPYGVRAGAKRLGRKKVREDRPLPQSPTSRDEPYIPPTKPYELSELVVDLILLARYLLKPHGLLVFFLPTVTDSYEEDFGSWGRRLVTIRKVTSDNYPPPTFEPTVSCKGDDIHTPAHKDFRGKYFQGFKTE